jgi:hypothetical protein
MSESLTQTSESTVSSAFWYSIQASPCPCLEMMSMLLISELEKKKSSLSLGLLDNQKDIPFGAQETKKVRYHSRFLRVILAQGPC